jgi:hypothetical protein
VAVVVVALSVVVVLDCPTAVDEVADGSVVVPVLPVSDGSPADEEVEAGSPSEQEANSIRRASTIIRRMNRAYRAFAPVKPDGLVPVAGGE